MQQDIVIEREAAGSASRAAVDATSATRQPPHEASWMVSAKTIDLMLLTLEALGSHVMPAGEPEKYVDTVHSPC